jgi:hypothetical protein
MMYRCQAIDSSMSTTDRKELLLVQIGILDLHKVSSGNQHDHQIFYSLLAIALRNHLNDYGDVGIFVLLPASRRIRETI